MKCPECGAGDNKICDQDCMGCEGSGECGFCQGEPQHDCPYGCDDGVCIDCGGSGYEEGHAECIECGVQDVKDAFVDAASMDDDLAAPKGV